VESLNGKKIKIILKSKKGGISYLVFEVIMTVIILSLLVVVIYIFRNNMDIIGSSAKRVNDTDKIKADLMLPLDKGVVTGSEVISIIRYYSTASDDESMSVEVNVDGIEVKYRGETYDPQSFYINYEDKFLGSYGYEGTKITSIKYNKKND
jgi:hypothetical protein